MADQQSGWVKTTPVEIEKKVIDLAKQGISPEKIGLKLRDEQGIPKVKVLGLQIKKILKENNLWEDPEIKNIEKKLELLGKHSKTNIHDYKAKRSIVKYNSRLNKLKKN